MADAQPILAICDDCGEPFPAGHIDETGIGLGRAGQSLHIGHMVTGPTGMQVTDTTVGPCPRCGGDGRIPDGTYSFIRRVIVAVRSANLSTESGRNLAQALREAASSPAAAQRALDLTPTALRPVVDEALQSKVHLRLLAWLIPVLIAIGAVTVAHRDAQQAHRDAQQAHADAVRALQAPHPVDDQLVRVIEELNASLQVQAKAAPKVGRNEPCFCRSGRKFKYCHGSSTGGANASNGPATEPHDSDGQ